MRNKKLLLTIIKELEEKADFEENKYDYIKDDSEEIETRFEKL